MTCHYKAAWCEIDLATFVFMISKSLTLSSSIPKLLLEYQKLHIKFSCQMVCCRWAVVNPIESTFISKMHLITLRQKRSRTCMVARFAWLVSLIVWFVYKVWFYQFKSNISACSKTLLLDHVNAFQHLAWCRDNRSAILHLVCWELIWRTEMR